MWTRKELKDIAKELMSKNYFRMLGVSAIASILTGSVYYYITTYFDELGNIIDTPSDPITTITFENGQENIFLFFLALLFVGSLVGFVFRTLYNIFIANPIMVGTSRYFINNRYQQGRFNNLFYAFSHHYLNSVKIIFLMNLKIFLWTLLLIIPGIIKAYEYSMIPYILAERPDISSEEAFKLSKKLTDDQKIHLFNLDLSFIGWLLLGALACGVGIIFVLPYYNATQTEVYFKLKEIKQVGITPDIPVAPTI